MITVTVTARVKSRRDSRLSIIDNKGPGQLRALMVSTHLKDIKYVANHLSL